MYTFDSSYREEVVLADGMVVVLRTVRPQDKELFRAGLERLSSTSRQSRFLAPRSGFSEAELRYLTEVDGIEHFAIGAIHHLAGGLVEGIGVGRFVRSGRDPTVAEPAVTVIDEHQGKGLGTVLLHRLVAAARERGVNSFHCEFFTHNRRVRSLLDGYADRALITHDRDLVTMDFPLPEPRPEERLRDLVHAGPMQGVLRHAARGGLSLRSPDDDPPSGRGR
jgi:GNAT superfamily N-acetyltransferase